MQLNRSILRVFEVRPRPGKADILKRKLADTSVAVVMGKVGNLGYLFGEQISSDERDLLFISIWKNLDSIKAHFGENWRKSYLPDGYPELIERCSIKHIEVDGSLGS